MLDKFVRVLPGWIAALTEKAVPVFADWVLLEDSAAGDVKKKAKLGAILAKLGAFDIQVPLIKDETTPWITFNQATYQGVECANFRGTSTVGEPAKIWCTVRAKDAGKTCDVRIYDVDNDKVIVEKTGISNNSFARTDLGTITTANLSTGAARWEVQARKPTGGSGSEANVKFVHVEF